MRGKTQHLLQRADVSQSRRWAQGGRRRARAKSVSAGLDAARDGCELPRRQESVNPAVFEVESASLSSLRLPGNCQPCREMAGLFWKLALVPLQLLEMNLLFFPQLQISNFQQCCQRAVSCPCSKSPLWLAGSLSEEGEKSVPAPVCVGNRGPACPLCPQAQTSSCSIP